MAIPLTGSGGLFTRLGKAAKFLRLFNIYQATVPGSIEAVMAEYDTLRDAAAPLPAQNVPNRQGVGNIFPTLQTIAQHTVLEMVAADNPARATTLPAALQEVVTQMIAGSATVQSCAITAAATALSSNQGNGALVIATKRGDGRVQENAVAEVAPLLCTVDSQTGGAAQGNELFIYAGQPDDGDRSLDTWPTGSGASTSITAIAANQNNAGGNVLTNSDFEMWTGSPLALSQWTITTGAWGTDVVREGSTVYTGAYAVKIVGGSTLSAIVQPFNNAAVGTGGTLLPERSYAVNFHAKVDVVPAAGVITVELIDGSGTVIQDDQGGNNAQTFAVTSMTTSWVAKSALFRLPRLIPVTVSIRIRVSTAISSGTNLYLDDLAMGLMTALYNGGPSVAIFSGSTRWVAGDGWSITQTNDRGGATQLSTFQAMFDKFFGMRALGLLLPSSGSPTIADTLITS